LSEEKQEGADEGEDTEEEVREVKKQRKAYRAIKDKQNEAIVREKDLEKYIEVAEFSAFTVKLATQRCKTK